MGNRIVRKQETNIGDFCSDAIRAFTGADVAMLNGETGVFMQVSGMKYVVDSSVPTPVVMDYEEDLFLHIGEGDRRVSNLEIWDTESSVMQLHMTSIGEPMWRV